MTAALRHLLGIWVFASVVGPLNALDFLSTTQTVRPKPGADCVMGRFDFINHTTHTVHVLEIQTACGCTSATAEPNDIPAGKHGTVEVLFEIGHLTGTQSRDVVVHTDDAREPVRLTLRVELPATKRTAPAQ